MKLLVATATLLPVLFGGPPTARADWILPPEAAPTITRLADIQPKADKTGVLRSAKLDKTTVRVEAKRGDTVILAVTLVHPSQAPPEAFRGAGVALLESPGPIDKRALKALQKRLSQGPDSVVWREIAAEEPEPDAEALAKLDATLNRAAYLHIAGDQADARKTLTGLPDALPPQVAIRAALLWQKLDAEKAARAVLAGLGEGETAFDVAARAVLGAKMTPKEALGDATGDAACAFTELSGVLAGLARREEALAVAKAVLTRAPDCPDAWEAALHRHHEVGDLSGAATLADKTLAQFPRDKASNALLATIGASFLAANRYREAGELLEYVARRDPRDEGVLRILLSAILRDSDLRAEHTKRLEVAHKSQPDDVMTQFLLGIVYHYANRFEESSALLAPIEPTMGHQSRLHIYLAMNDFNLDRLAPAMARLDAAEHRTHPDPDIFYCRAEILRDTRREQARADLARYQAMSQGSPMSNPDKTARVQRMIADLDACITSGVAVCKSHWEHPRLKIHESTAAPATTDATTQPSEETAGSGSALPWLIGAGLALALGAWLWRRRRTEP